MAADGLGLLQGLRRSLPGLGRRLRPRSDKTVPRLALESGLCRLISGNAVPGTPGRVGVSQNWVFSSPILPMCSRSWV